MSNVQCAMCNSRPMKDSGIEWIGEIPESWKVVRTKNCYTNHKEIAGEKSDDFQRLALTLNGVIKRPKDDSTGLQPEAFNGYQILKENELVFKLIDLENTQTSRVGYSPYTGIVSPAYIVLNPKIRDESKFGEYYFLSMWQRHIFNHMGDDGVRSSLNASDLLNIPYLDFSIDEKNQIAEFLDKKCGEIDEVIAKTEKTIEEYKALKQSVITEAVTKGIRPDRPMKDSGIEWIGQIPEDSSIYRLKHLLKSPLLYGANESGVPFDEKLPRYIRITDISMDGNLKDYGKLSLTEEMAQGYILEDNDILFARSGATVGKAFIYKKEYGLSAFAGYLIKASLNEEKVIPQYLFLYTQSSLYEEWKKQIFVQATIQNIGADRYSSLPVVLPSILIQEEIVNYLNSKCKEIDKLIEAKQQLLTELQTYKKSVIYEYVTGKKEV